MKFKLTIYTKSVLQLLALAVIGWLLYTVRGVLVYLVIATILTLVAKPVTNFISSRKIGARHIPRALSAAVSLLLLVVVFTLVATLIVPALYRELAVLSAIDFGSVYENALQKISLLKHWAADREINLNEIEDSIRNGVNALLSAETLKGTVSSILGGLGNIAIAGFSIVFILFFLLKEENITHALLEDYLPKSLSRHIEKIVPKVKVTIYRYSLGLAMQMTGIFLIVFIGLTIAGVQSAIVIAVAAAFFNLIPYVGPMIGATFALILALGQSIALHPEASIGLLALKIVAVFGVTQLTDNFIFQPLIFSNSIKAHPLEIFLVISFAGLLGGIIGMIIAVPAYGMLRIVIKEFWADSKFVQSLTRNV